jgi:hypothetical protein
MPFNAFAKPIVARALVSKSKAPLVSLTRIIYVYLHVALWACPICGPFVVGAFQDV